MTQDTPESLQREVEELRRLLAEAREMIRAIQGGEVDAVVITESDQPRVYTLDSADKPYRLLVAQMHQPAATLTVSGDILYCNHRFSQLLRHPLEDLLGRPLHDFVEPTSVPILDALLHDGLSVGAQGEVVLRRDDGSSVPVFLGVSALSEGVAGKCLIVTDLSEQKRRDRLVADEAMARSILEQVADAVIVCDESGMVLRASRAAHDMCGINPIQRPFASAFPLTGLRIDGHEHDEVDLGPAWRGETIRGWEVCFHRPTGQRAELLLSAGPLAAAGNQVLGAVITLTDITPLRQAEDELRRRAVELQDADQRKDEFLAMLAHELRNPLSPIRSSLEIMRIREVDDPHVRKSRDIIGRQVDHLTRLVDDLLEVSRINSGKIELQRERLTLASVVARAVEASRPAIDAKGHHLVVSLKDTPVWVDADLTRLTQVLGNLIHNAAKYTPDGGRITIEAGREGPDAVIRVRDTGFGLPVNMLSRVFDMFTQVNRSLDRSQGGLGIGLALVRRLVAMHGGQVEARSEGPGCGSEFIVRLPALEVEPAETRAPAAAANEAVMASRRVLVVDDNPDAAESLSMLLGMRGHEVRTASDGPSAIAAATEFRPDVVLCDIGLPLMDGYEVVAQLRGRPELAATRFVALTGYGREEDIKRSYEAGFHLHLVKPVDVAKLDVALGRPG